MRLIHAAIAAAVNKWSSLWRLRLGNEMQWLGLQFMAHSLMTMCVLPAMSRNIPLGYNTFLEIYFCYTNHNITHTTEHNNFITRRVLQFISFFRTFSPFTINHMGKLFFLTSFLLVTKLPLKCNFFIEIIVHISLPLQWRSIKWSKLYEEHIYI